MMQYALNVHNGSVILDRLGISEGYPLSPESNRIATSRIGSFVPTGDNPIALLRRYKQGTAILVPRGQKTVTQLGSP